MSTNPRLQSATAAFQRGDLDQALAVLEQNAGEQGAAEHHLLGLIHCRKGDFAQGVDHLGRALQLEPANDACRVMLARALVDSGQASDVLAMAEPQPAGSPAWLAFQETLSQAAEAVQDLHSAARAWSRLAQARPGDWRPHANLASALAGLADWAAAFDSFARAVRLNPDDPSLRRSFAAALGAGGQPQQAVDQLQHALTLQPSNVPLRLELARLLVAATRFDEAEALYRSVLSDVPNEPSALRELGLLLERTRRIDLLRELLSAHQDSDAEVGYLRAVISLRDGEPAMALEQLQTEDPARDPERWHRVRARIADSIGDAAQAFAAAQAMNRAAPDYEQWRERGRAYRQRLRSITDATSAVLVAGLPTLPPASRPSPAFLVGFPRSGTTLLDTFLMGHSRIAVLEEQHMLMAAEQAIGSAADLKTATSETLASARDRYFAELDRHVEPGFAGLVIDKLPLNMLGLPLIYALFPDARIIFAQRHPCDAVLSGFMQSFVLNDAMACFLDIEDAADLYDTALEAWTRARAVVPLGVHTLVYEKLVEEPEHALRPLVEFLGLDWRGELLDHRATAEKRGVILTPSYDQVTEKLSRAPSGRWRGYEKQLAPVLPILLPWARRLGYGDLPAKR